VQFIYFQYLSQKVPRSGLIFHNSHRKWHTAFINLWEQSLVKIHNSIMTKWPNSSTANSLSLCIWSHKGLSDQLTTTTSEFVTEPVWQCRLRNKHPQQFTKSTASFIDTARLFNCRLTGYVPTTKSLTKSKFLMCIIKIKANHTHVN